MKKLVVLLSLVATGLFAAHANAVPITFDLDLVPDGSASYTDTQSGLQLTLQNAVSSTGSIVASVNSGGVGIHPGLTFDFSGKDMTSLDLLFDADVSILGYSITQFSSGDFADGTETLTLGGVTGLAASIGTHNLLTPIDLSGGTSLTITESSGLIGALQYFTISSITVETTTVPEPTTVALMALGFSAMTYRRKRPQS